MRTADGDWKQVGANVPRAGGAILTWLVLAFMSGWAALLVLGFI